MSDPLSINAILTKSMPFLILKMPQKDIATVNLIMSGAVEDKVPLNLRILF